MTLLVVLLPVSSLSRSELTAEQNHQLMAAEFHHLIVSHRKPPKISLPVKPDKSFISLSAALFRRNSTQSQLPFSDACISAVLHTTVKTQVNVWITRQNTPLLPSPIVCSVDNSTSVNHLCTCTWLVITSSKHQRCATVLKTISLQQQTTVFPGSFALSLAAWSAWFWSSSFTLSTWPPPATNRTVNRRVCIHSSIH